MAPVRAKVCLQSATIFLFLTATALILDLSSFRSPRKDPIIQNIREFRLQLLTFEVF